MENIDPKKILVIDDEPSLREGARRILSKMDFEVFLAPKGEDGLDTIDKEPVAIVLLDMKMPNGRHGGIKADNGFREGNSCYCHYRLCNCRDSY